MTSSVPSGENSRERPLTATIRPSRSPKRVPDALRSPAVDRDETRVAARVLAHGVRDRDPVQLRERDRVHDVDVFGERRDDSLHGGDDAGLPHRLGDARERDRELRRRLRHRLPDERRRPSRRGASTAAPRAGRLPAGTAGSPPRRRASPSAPRRASRRSRPPRGPAPRPWRRRGAACRAPSGAS